MYNSEELIARYLKACHAMQSGVAASIKHDDSATPKHLRVGVNSAMVEHSALVKLLISKGIITEEEHLIALAEGMEEEVKRYEAILTAMHGKTIKLA